MGNRLENRQQSSGHRVGCAHHGYIRMIFTMSSAFWLLSSVFRLMSPCLSSVIVHLSPFWCGTVLSSVVIWHQFFSTFISLTKVFSYSQQENIINRLIMFHCATLFSCVLILLCVCPKMCARWCCFRPNIAAKFVNSTIFARTYNIIWTSALYRAMREKNESLY